MRNHLNLIPANPHDPYEIKYLEDLKADSFIDETQCYLTSVPLGIRVFIKFKLGESSYAEPFFQIGKMKPHIPNVTHAFAFNDLVVPTNNFIKRIHKNLQLEKIDVLPLILTPSKDHSLSELYHSIKSYRKNHMAFNIHTESLLTETDTKHPEYYLPKYVNRSGEIITDVLSRYLDKDYVHYMVTENKDGVKKYYYIIPDYDRHNINKVQHNTFGKYIGRKQLHYIH
jgi:hypothetical protein